jgi:hypothetical protein
MAYLNTRAFTVVSIIFIVTNPYCVTGFDIIQDFSTAWSLTSRSHAIICRLDIVKNK